MDNDLGVNDPYRTMNSGEEGIQPEFLKNKSGETASKTLGNIEKAAQLAMAAKGGKVPTGEAAGETAGGVGVGATGGASGAKKSAEEGLKSGAEKPGKEESSPSLYKGKRGQEKDDDEPSLKMSKGSKMAIRAALPVVLILLVVGGLIALIVGLPMMMIGAIDYNLQKVLGFSDTVGILEEQGEYVTAELAASGKMPREYFEDLVANGIDVGQVTANGDFVRTDTYIANIEGRDDLVASAGGFSYVGDTEGELAMMFDGKIIYADDFVAEVESNPVLYAAYADAADLGAKYYYSQDVEKIYQEMGISRGAFNGWESTGNYEEDEKNFFDIVKRILNAGSNIQVGWYSKDDDSEAVDGSTQSIVGEAKEIVSAVASKTKEYITNGVSAVKRAAQLLNTAVSSGEPFLASLVFMAIEEPLQRARVDGDGPVNVVMNALTSGKWVSYRDVATGETKSTDNSILETDNFRAAVSDEDYSKSEAQNFGRDRVLISTGQGDKTTIQETTTATNGKANSTSVVRNGFLNSADEAALSGAVDAIDLAVTKENSELFQTVVGGNRAIEGGSFISNTVNMRQIGAMPSNSDKISEYHQEVEKVMARKAEAERATKSPFDVSSPNTFLGSIVHNIATMVVGNYNSNSTALSVVNSASGAAGKAIANLTGSAVADGNDSGYSTMSGDGCETVKSVGVEGDLYCTSHNTVSTNYMNKTKLDWDLLIDKDGFGDFVKMGMDRYATVGVKSAEVCERYRDKNDSAWSKISSFFTDMVGLYDACDEDHVPADIATGARYTFGSQGDYNKTELYSGFALYDKVRSLLTGEQSTVAAIREEYYKDHPLDNSQAGVIARISGMEKYEAEMVLSYADYLGMIADYNPAGRYTFGAPAVMIESPVLEYHSDSVALELYAWYSKETEYDDLRTRNFVV